MWSDPRNRQPRYCIGEDRTWQARCDGSCKSDSEASENSSETL